MPATISIITVNYNNACGLKATIESILSQNYIYTQYIIIDGGSTDDSINIIKSNESSIDIWVSESDSGIYDAMNKGISYSKGDWICFMNSGDLFYSSTTLSNVFENNTYTCDLLYGKTFIKESGNISTPPIKLSTAFFMFNTICHQSVFFRKELFNDIGRYNTHYKIIADRIFFHKSLVNAKKFVYVDIIISRWESIGYSSKNINILINEESSFISSSYTLLERLSYNFIFKIRRLLIHIKKKVIQI